jgi:hypothetical protein
LSFVILCIILNHSSLNAVGNDECPITITGEVSEVKCNSRSDGNIDITANGPDIHSYLWSNGSTQEDLADIKAGSYTVTVSNSQCFATATFSVNEPAPLSLDIKNKKDVTCNGYADGELILEGNGGTQPYQFSINNGSTYVSTEVFKKLSEGNHDVFIKDKNNCTSSLNILIQAPPQQKVDLGSERSVLSGAELILDAGKGFSNYQWNTGETTQTITIKREVKVPFKEEFFVTVTDATGCSYNSNKLAINIIPAGIEIEQNNTESELHSIEPVKPEEQPVEEVVPEQESQESK